MATNSAILPRLSMEGDPAYRYFGPRGCVEARTDGRFAVYVGGSLLGTYSQSEPAERDALIVVVQREPRTKAKQVAAAFRVSGETVRRARVRAEQGGLAAVAQRRRRGAPLKRTPALRRRALRLFGQGMRVAAAHRVLSKRVSRETVRQLYHEWHAERRDPTESNAAAITREQMALNCCDGVATDATRESPEVANVAVNATAPAASTPEQVLLTAAGGAANQNDTTSESPEVASVEANATAPVASLPEQAAREAAAEQAREELPLEETVAARSGEMVQHVGSWLMLAMLQWLGLYELAKAACGKTVSPVALRIALDAVAIALTLGEQCVEGVRRLATSSAGTLLRSRGAISASWTRRVLARFAAEEGMGLQLGLVWRLLGRNQEAQRVWLYVDGHLRPYTGQQVIRKGWRMQDKRVRPGTSDYYVHDEEGRPLFRIAAPGHGSLTHWLQPIADFVRGVLRDAKPACLCFDRGGAFPEQMAELRDGGTGFVTYERAPYARLTRATFDKQLTLVRSCKPKEPVVIRYTEQHQKNLGKGRGRVRRVCLLMPDGAQVNLLAANCDEPAAELIRRQLARWGYQENQFKHEIARWGINQLDGRRVEPYPPDAIIPNPARRRLDRNLRLARAREGVVRSELARLEQNHPRRSKLEEDLQHILAQQQELEALRPSTPTHAPVRDTELADQLVYHPGEYKRVIDTLRIGLANCESELAARLAPHLSRPREAKKTLANLLAAPGVVKLTRRAVTVCLAPTGTAAELQAFNSLLEEVTALKLTLPGDLSRRPLRLQLHT